MSSSDSPADWCAEQLKASDEYLLSSYALWRKYRDAFDSSTLDYDDFEQLLRSDDRFHVTPGIRSSLAEIQQEALDTMGFPIRALVGLVSRKPTADALETAIRAKAVHLRHALQKAWEARSPDNPEIERRLLSLIEQAQKVCDALKPQENESSGNG